MEEENKAVREILDKKLGKKVFAKLKEKAKEDLEPSA